MLTFNNTKNKQYLIHSPHKLSEFTFMKISTDQGQDSDRMGASCVSKEASESLGKEQLNKFKRQTLKTEQGRRNCKEHLLPLSSKSKNFPKISFFEFFRARQRTNEAN